MIKTTQMKWHEIARSTDKDTRHVMGISGGKDSVAAVVATVVVEEVTKATIMNQVKKLDKNYSKNEKKY